ncbi:MAG: hypothetical protein ABI629_22135 [bacterium]
MGAGVLLIALSLGLSTPAAHAADKAKRKPAAAAGPAASDEKIADDLKGFCVKWMGFLAKRESDNSKAIKWQTKPTGVAGQYVGYSKEYDCVMKDRSSNGTPVAVIIYKEFIYEKAGASRPEAEQATAAVVDATEVTEIFRYSKNEWVY